MDDAIAFIEALKKKWTTSKRYKPPFVGCSYEQVGEIMEKQGVEYLPPIYEHFLLEMGISAAGLIHPAGDFQYPDVLMFKGDRYPRLPIPIEDYQVPEGIMVFLSDRDLFAMFFRTLERENNPMVYLVSDVEPENIVSEAGKLSDYFEDWVGHAIQGFEDGGS